MAAWDAVEDYQGRGEFADGPFRPGSDDHLDERVSSLRPVGTRVGRGRKGRLRDDGGKVEVAGLLEEANLDGILEEMDEELVGLAHVKGWVRQLTALLFIDGLRRTVGLRSEMPTLHMCFTGNPGTGKTTVALHMGRILHRLGFVRGSHFVSVTREDLVGEFIGHTAPKTRRVLRKAMGGVLFIDEAYALHRPDNERDFGSEVVELLLQVMENQRNDIVVIMAGYKDKMERFLADAPGLGSRIAHHIHFPDYTIDELMEIARRMLDRQSYRFTKTAEDSLRAQLQAQMLLPNFANARTVRNALDEARMRQALRLYREGARRATLTRKQLATLDARDVAAAAAARAGA